MKVCYLHLGMPKTGSTAIQDAFYGYRDGQLAYAGFKRRNHGLPLAAIFSKTPERLREFAWYETTPAAVGREVQALRKQFDKICARRKSIIFSGEAVIDQLTPAEFATLASELKAAFDRVVPILYVRPILSMAPSQLQQRIRMGQANLRLSPPQYRRRMGAIADNFEAADIRWIRFSRDDLFGGDIVADFAHQLGLSAPPAATARANETASAEVLGALLAFNTYVAPHLSPRARTEARRDLDRRLRGAGHTRFALAPDLLEQHLETHRDEVQWAEEICQFDLQGRLTPQPGAISTAAELMALAAAPPPSS